MMGCSVVVILALCAQARTSWHVAGQGNRIPVRMLKRDV
jgi:hypothetical protein